MSHGLGTVGDWLLAIPLGKYMLFCGLEFAIQVGHDFVDQPDLTTESSYCFYLSSVFNTSTGA